MVEIRFFSNFSGISRNDLLTFFSHEYCLLLSFKSASSLTYYGNIEECLKIIYLDSVSTVFPYKSNNGDKNKIFHQTVKIIIVIIVSLCFVEFQEMM